MAEITLSGDAPNEKITFSLGSAEPFTLSGSGSYSTDDAEQVSAASAHPWLSVDGAVSEPEAPAEDDAPVEDAPAFSPFDLNEDN